MSLAAVLAALASSTLACGGAAPATPAPGATGPALRDVTELNGAVDPLPFLRDPAPSASYAWVRPRRAALEMGAATADAELSAAELAAPLSVMVVETAATMMRVAVRTETLRFVVWVAREDLLAVLTQEVTAPEMFVVRAPIGATLHKGAHVEVLERGDDRTKVRFSGAVELETWVPNEALADRTEQEPPEVHPVIGAKMMHAPPGLAIRTAPRSTSPLVAVVARIYLVTDLRAIDSDWHEVRYTDLEITVQGFASKREPPMRIARPAADKPTSTLVSNDALPAGACLYAEERGAIVGVVEAQVDAAVERGQRDGWWQVTVETPWGPLRFAAHREQGGWAGCDAATD